MSTDDFLDTYKQLQYSLEFDARRSSEGKKSKLKMPL